VEACPVRSGEDLATRALAMRPKDDGLVSTAREHFAFFSSLPDVTPAKVDSALVRGAQFLTPLFEYSGACAGCGETPYLRLLTQLFGDRLLVANATGCSSIYGGNLPTTPWSFNKDGRGPAWSNSLFEDNAEFGLGYRVSIDKHRQQAEELLTALVNDIGPDLVQELRNAPQVTAAEIDAQRSRVGALDRALAASIDPRARQLRSLAGYLVRKTVWIVGGDGWAYDIGYGGLDHVLASGRNVNLLVLDTEVYSNTGGQASKATPRGSVARFAAGGKQSRKKDLGLMAMGYGNVYVAQIAMGASPQQTLDALREAEMHEGPSLVIAYGHCIAHGIDMRLGLRQQKLAVDCGHWPLYRFRPAGAGRACEEFVLDSLPPSIPFQAYAYNEIRYRMLADSRPEEAERLLALAQEDVHHRWQVYKDLARRWPVSPGTAPQTPRDATA
jgi:pyruvate-ferredoxin/flavodoxin oxidoreductase